MEKRGKVYFCIKVGRITMSDLFKEIKSIAYLEKEDGSWADAVYQLDDFDTFQPRNNGMVWIALSENNSREFLEGAIDFLLNNKILVVR